MRTDDPWYDALASGRGDENAPATATPPPRGGEKHDEAGDAQAAVYLAVQRSAAFQQVRRRYRSFALPVSAAFLLWYLAYVVAATTAPGLMARPVAGVLNVAMAAGLAQFATTFLVTWAYVRHARLRRDRLALELRWETQDMAMHAAGRSAGAYGAPANGPPGATSRAGVPAARTSWGATR